MTDERDAEGNLLPDEQRLTKVWKFVRSTSISPRELEVAKTTLNSALQVKEL